MEQSSGSISFSTFQFLIHVFAYLLVWLGDVTQGVDQLSLAGGL
jgi:hypothetical protein